MPDNSDDEWEYEYSTTETEDFYIPIDLSNVPSAQVPMNLERRPGHPTLLSSRLRALNAVRGQLPEPTAEGLNTEDTATMGEIQITGLHTPNPLIMYNNQLLSCHWNSTIGTDIFFTKPGAIEGDALRSLPAVDLVALGTAKLVARVGRLRPRDDVIATQSDPEVTENPPVAMSEATDPTPAATPAPKKPSSFLTKLNEAKAKRGETTRLVVNPSAEGPRLLSEYVGRVQLEGEGQAGVDDDVAMGGT